MDPRTLTYHLASSVQARLNCLASDHREWFRKHEDRIKALAYQYLPSGSGVDCGTHVDLDRSTGGKIVLTLSFHHMDNHGSYDGWTDHAIIIRPTFDGIDVTVTGRNRRDIKSYLADLYHAALVERLPEADWRALCAKSDGTEV